MVCGLTEIAVTTGGEVSAAGPVTWSSAAEKSITTHSSQSPSGLAQYSARLPARSLIDNRCTVHVPGSAPGCQVHRPVESSALTTVADVAPMKASPPVYANWAHLTSAPPL